jgi:hypothetical protein
MDLCTIFIGMRRINSLALELARRNPSKLLDQM